MKIKAYLVQNIIIFITLLSFLTFSSFAEKNNSNLSLKQSIILQNETTTLKNAKIVHITDGDTITVEHLSKQYKIRLLGINTPELFNNPPQPYALQAKEYLFSILYNTYIDVVYYNSLKTDKYNRILANLYKNNVWINKILIEKGFAVAYIIGIHPYANDVKELFIAEANAIKKNINLWSLDIYKPITVEQAPQYIGQYKIIDAKVKEIRKTNNAIWIELEDDNFNKIGSSVSLRINKKDFANFNMQWIEKLVGKNITIHGFIERYSTKFAPYIGLSHPANLIIY
jgi:micrococcal nuclease